jgi:threonine/homoserine/homoserine lactone efflux protein
MVFYLALLPTLIDVQATGLREGAVLAAVTVATLAAADLLWIALAQRARAFLRTPRAVRLSNRLSAAVMGGAAAAIAAKV